MLLVHISKVCLRRLTMRRLTTVWLCKDSYVIFSHADSMRHNADGRPPAVKGPHLQMVTEEGESRSVLCI